MTSRSPRGIDSCIVCFCFDRILWFVWWSDVCFEVLSCFFDHPSIDSNKKMPPSPFKGCFEVVGNDQKTIDVWERIFIASSLSVDCESVFHPSTSFPRDLGNGMSFSQDSTPPTSSSSCSAWYTIIDCTRPSKLRAWRSSSKFDLAFGWLRSQEEE